MEKFIKTENEKFSHNTEKHLEQTLEQTKITIIELLLVEQFICSAQKPNERKKEGKTLFIKRSKRCYVKMSELFGIQREFTVYGSRALGSFHVEGSWMSNLISEC